MNSIDTTEVGRGDCSIGMRCLRRLAVPMFALSLLSACGGGRDSESAGRETVAFEAAQRITEPKILTGDPTSGRCADTTQPCFDGKSDFFYGQRKMLRVDDLAVFTQRSETLTSIAVPSRMII